MEEERSSEDPIPPGSSADANEALVRRFLAHDRATTARVQALVTRIVSFRGFFVPRHERPDVVQEVLLDLWDAVSRPGFNARDSFEAFARTVTYRRCTDWRRARRPTVTIESPIVDGARGPEAHALARERFLLGVRILGRLGQGCRELIRLHTTEGLTYSEIGARLGRSEGALRVQMHGCLDEARRELARLRKPGKGHGGRGRAAR